MESLASLIKGSNFSFSALLRSQAFDPSQSYGHTVVLKAPLRKNSGTDSAEHRLDLAKSCLLHAQYLLKPQLEAKSVCKMSYSSDQVFIQHALVEPGIPSAGEEIQDPEIDTHPSAVRKNCQSQTWSR